MVDMTRLQTVHNRLRRWSVDRNLILSHLLVVAVDVDTAGVEDVLHAVGVSLPARLVQLQVKEGLCLRQSISKL